MPGYLWGKGGCDWIEPGRVAGSVLFLMQLCFLSENSLYIGRVGEEKVFLEPLRVPGWSEN